MGKRSRTGRLRLLRQASAEQGRTRDDVHRPDGQGAGLARGLRLEDEARPCLTYRVRLVVELDADSSSDARELLRPWLEQLFGEPFVLALHCDMPRWVPQKPGDGL